jgi:hypothetical protein
VLLLVAALSMPKQAASVAVHQPRETIAEVG